MIKNVKANGTGYLEAGDVFSVEHYKSFPSKYYPDRMVAKILTTDGDIIFTSAAKIVKILDALSADPEITDLSRYTFEVVQTGEYNGYPVLSIYSDNMLIRKKLMKIFM